MIVNANHKAAEEVIGRTKNHKDNSPEIQKLRQAERSWTQDQCIRGNRKESGIEKGEKQSDDKKSMKK